MKKMLSLVLLLFISIGLTQASQSETYYYGSGFEYIYGFVQVYGDDYVRDLPDNSSSMIGSVCRGMSFDFLGDIHVDDNGVEWYRVVWNSNTTGWISSINTVLFED